MDPADNVSVAMQIEEQHGDRLDKDKKGQLDAKELEQSKLRVSHPANVS
jgi:hypothetical protein